MKLNGFLLHTTNDNIKSCDLDLTYFIFWREDNIKLPFWSGLHLLKLACFFSFKSNSNKTLKPMQDFNGWNVEEMKHSHRWERGVNKGRRWKFGNYTVRPITGHTHTHTFNANSSTTGKTLKFENVCIWLEYSYTQNSHFTSNILKAILLNQELHPEEFQPLITITPQGIKSIYIDIYMSVYIYIYI